MSRRSPALTEARKEEIIQACAKLYETMSFKEITIKEIGAATSFTRTSIYNYFETKEEIFLALLQREYEKWAETMNGIMEQKETMPRDELAQTLAQTLTARPRLLRLLSMNLYDIEAHSRPERLAEFKVTFGASMETVGRMVKKYIPQMNDAELQRFLYAFFPFIYGIYPYTVVSEKQKLAMDQAGILYVYLSAYDLTYACLKKLLAVIELSERQIQHERLRNGSKDENGKELLEK